MQIARARQRHNMTQAELASKLGVPRTTVAAWEIGRQYPSRNAGRIEELLGILIPARPAA